MIHRKLKVLKIFSVLFFSGLLASCVAGSTLSPSEVTGINPDSIRYVGGNVFSAGQPTSAEFTKLKEKGIKTVINLRSPSETDRDQQELMSRLGFNYINLPIQGAAGITKNNARALVDLIDQNDDKPLLVHCGSGNRVGALIATAEYTINRSDIETAIMEGKKWGLTRLEPRVREILNCTTCE